MDVPIRYLGGDFVDGRKDEELLELRKGIRLTEQRAHLYGLP